MKHLRKNSYVVLGKEDVNNLKTNDKKLYNKLISKPSKVKATSMLDQEGYEIEIMYEFAMTKATQRKFEQSCHRQYTRDKKRYRWLHNKTIKTVYGCEIDQKLAEALNKIDTEAEEMELALFWGDFNK